MPRIRPSLGNPVTQGQLTALTGTFVPKAGSPPDPAVSPVYVDTSVTPNVLRQWDGAAFQPVASQPSAAGVAAGMALAFGV